MTTALVERPAESFVAAPTVTSEQLELVKKTVAAGATDAELKLYLYDCARHGVHPLDKLLHFTKRKGKYTPITSIDLMRIRAADTGDCLGITDPMFTGTAHTPEFAASVTVMRFVQGQVASFSATARWPEYYPGDGDPGFMWRKMPHTMLGKCAEALALRKGFPKQLAGLYAREEMDQAGSPQTTPMLVVEAPPDVPAAPPVSLPEGAVLIQRVEQGETAKGKPYWKLIDHHGEVYKEWDQRRAAAAEQYAQDRVPVVLETKVTQWGTDVKAIRKAVTPEREIQLRETEPPLAEYDDGPF
jgi:phage recombination protein Bet